MRAFAVVGTDTGVGKTHLTRALLAAAAAAGFAARPLKPILSGAVEEDDGVLLARDAGLPLEAVSPYRIAPPLSPAAAQRRRLAPPPDERRIDAALARARSAAPDLLLVEGIGGLHCPLDAERTWLDLHEDWNERFADAGGLPALLVARPGLGTLSHTLLSLEALAHRGIETRAIVLSDAAPDPADASREDNAEILAARTGLAVAEIPYERNPAAGNVVSAVARLLALRATA